MRNKDLSDYRIARKINTDPPSVTRSRKNAHKKLLEAMTDSKWVARIGFSASESNSNIVIGKFSEYNFFL